MKHIEAVFAKAMLKKYKDYPHWEWEDHHTPGGTAVYLINSDGQRKYFVSLSDACVFLKMSKNSVSALHKYIDSNQPYRGYLIKRASD